MRVLLVSTYDLGRQPFGLASPAAWLTEAGFEVDCVDASRAELTDGQLAAAALIGFYLPMHTATRLAVPLIDRARAVNPSARLCAYGLYAPLNEGLLRERGVADVLGPEFEGRIVDLARQWQSEQYPLPSSSPGLRGAHGEPPPIVERGADVRGLQAYVGSESRVESLPRLRFMRPDRSGLPPLTSYASLRMPDGTRRVMGSTDATRGCKHHCRHCPIVPVYDGQFRVVPVDVVLDDIRLQVSAGAEHMSFGDPDFLNGPAHARRLVERMSREWPGLSYDVTIKIEHLLQHANLIPVLRDTGCLFITSAVEAIDDRVLALLRKGHTHADFVRAVELCTDVGVTLVPTFVPFTPWTTPGGFVELLDEIESLELVEHVAPVQLAIRLLITSGSPLLELPEVSEVVSPFDPASLTWPWRHADGRVDALQSDIMRLVQASSALPRSTVFTAMSSLARERAGLRERRSPVRPAQRVPYVSEPWYCCAEPMETI